MVMMAAFVVRLLWRGRSGLSKGFHVCLRHLVPRAPFASDHQGACRNSTGNGIFFQVAGRMMECLYFCGRYPLVIRPDPIAPCGRSEAIPWFHAKPAIPWPEIVGDVTVLALPLLLCLVARCLPSVCMVSNRCPDFERFFLYLQNACLAVAAPSVSIYLSFFVDYPFLDPVFTCFVSRPLTAAAAA